MPFDRRKPSHRRALARLETELAIWFTSVSPGGQPQTGPVWFLWEEDSALVYSRSAALRNRNITENPQVSLHLNHDGTGSDVVSFEGLARIDSFAPRANENAPYMGKYGEFIVSMTLDEFASRFSVPIRIRPMRIKVFGA